MSKKLLYSFIKKSFEIESCVLLTNNYVNNRQKLKYICPNDHLHETIWDVLREGSRCPTCAYIKISGDGHPNWQDGITCEPYCDAWADKEYKESIKERDGYMCLNPYCKNKDTRLHIHHIDYNKKNCTPWNLITLCGSCNTMANYARTWHKHWYQTIMSKRYNYIYTKD